MCIMGVVVYPVCNGSSGLNSMMMRILDSTNIHERGGGCGLNHCV